MWPSVIVFYIICELSPFFAISWFVSGIPGKGWKKGWRRRIKQSIPLAFAVIETIGAVQYFRPSLNDMLFYLNNSDTLTLLYLPSKARISGVHTDDCDWGRSSDSLTFYRSTQKCIRIVINPLHAQTFPFVTFTVDLILSDISHLKYGHNLSLTCKDEG